MHSASLAKETLVENQTHGRKFPFTLACCLLALALIAAVQPLHAVVGPRWAYILDGAGLIHTYSVTRANGSLVATACVPVPAGVSPISLKIDPSNSFVFVADDLGNQILGYMINPANGCLAPTAQVFIPTVGAHPASLHITADGRYLYVSDTLNAAGTIEGFSITPLTGQLVPLAGFPFAYGPNQGPLAYDPVDDFLLAAVDAGPAGPIVSFNVAAGGALAFAAASATVLPNPNAMTTDAVRGYVFVLSGAAVVDSYRLNLANGALVPINNQPTGAGPAHVVATSIGQLAYVTNNLASSVSSYSIGPAGNLVKFAGPDTALRAPALNPAESTIDANGEFLYTADQSGDISIFKISGGKAVEIGAALSPFPLGFGPNAIALTQ